MSLHIQTTDSHWFNVTIFTSFIAWVAAQSIKFMWHYARTREMDFRFYVSTGGMPSAHSSLVSALATSVCLRAGPGSIAFAIALVFAVVVMFDAQSVRRASGQQARLLNQIVQELFKEHHFSKEKMAELLGHTRKEVFAGMLLGIVVAAAIHGLWRP